MNQIPRESTYQTNRYTPDYTSPGSFQRNILYSPNTPPFRSPDPQISLPQNHNYNPNRDQNPYSLPYARPSSPPYAPYNSVPYPRYNRSPVHSHSSRASLPPTHNLSTTRTFSRLDYYPSNKHCPQHISSDWEPRVSRGKYGNWNQEEEYHYRQRGDLLRLEQSRRERDQTYAPSTSRSNHTNFPYQLNPRASEFFLQTGQNIRNARSPSQQQKQFVRLPPISVGPETTSKLGLIGELKSVEMNTNAGPSGINGAQSSRGFEQLSNILTELGDLKVDQLKQVIRLVNSSAECVSKLDRMTLSGRKEELLIRIKYALTTTHSNGFTAAFDALSRIINDVSNDRIGPGSAHSLSNPSSPAVEYRSYTSSVKPQQLPPLPSLSTSHKSSGGSVASWTKNPYAGLNTNHAFRPGGLTTVNGGGASQPGNLPMNFKSSPFYKQVAAVSDVISLNKAGQNDRKTVFAPITISEWQRQLLNNTEKFHQLRVFCTSEDFYIIPPPHRPSNYSTHPKGFILMEFPVQCELKLNGYMVSGNLRGIKKVPGTAAPPNLGGVKKDNGEKVLNLVAGAVNRAELSYANIEKRHYMQVYLCEVTTIPQLIEKLKKGKSQTKEGVVKQIKDKAADEDIVMEASELSLRCPVSFIRMTTPVRSVNCTHLQCFEAFSFLSMMEQTPTWLCPVCNRKVSLEELALDGYTEDILNQVPDSVDAVLVETDGTWRSSDNKHGNAKDVGKVQEPLSLPQASTSSSLPTSTTEPGPPKDVIVFDDSDDDGSFNTSHRTPNITASSIPISSHRLRQSSVIDLTVSDDDELAQPPSRSSVPNALKRRAPDEWEAERAANRVRLSDKTVWD